MKHILIDGTTLSRKTDGLTQYSLSIVLELLKNTVDRYTLIHRKDEIPSNYIPQLQAFSGRLDLEPVNISPIGPKRDLQFYRWFKKNKKRFDEFYEPSAQYPFGVSGGIYTVHDILYEKYPEKLGKYSFIKKWYLHHVVNRGVKKAREVIAVSQFTKDELCKVHGKKYETKIQVVYEGYEHLTTVKINKENPLVKKLIDNYSPYFLYIGSSRGHKNLRNLFLAFEKSSVTWYLLVVGRMDRLTDDEKDLVKRINTPQEKIIFTGWIDDSQMYTILSNAAAFVFPSKSEGFGIPILESWYFNVPLLCSDIAVFNEVAGNACIKFNPFDTDSMAEVLKSFSECSATEKIRLIESQDKKLTSYSWKKAAIQIAALLHGETIV
ncbi:MAG: glycosyltransferase family 4 protein [Treponema sp.]|nr:glycosyltransferase family 4 protein [Treponema sp.]